MGVPRSERVHFRNLDALRFVAALAVFAHHAERFLSRESLPNFAQVPIIRAMGTLGVTFFFVLSGYLITYLLLAEIEKIGAVRVRDFYVRRALRICPLYFVILLLALLVLPLLGVAGTEFRAWEHVLMFVLFVPNIAVVVRPLVGFISHTWSIGVEAKFYVLWPVLLRVFRKPLRVLLGVLVAYLAVYACLTFLASRDSSYRWAWKIVRLTRIDCMAIGGIAAYAAKEHLAGVLRLVSNRVVQGLVPAAVLVMIASGASASYLTEEMYAVLFALVIVTMSLPVKTVIDLERPWLSYLGRISYGFYMVHPACIVLGMWAIRHTGVFEWSTGVGRVCLYVVSFATTVLVSALSYRFLESPFLRSKARFTTVSSGAPPAT